MGNPNLKENKFKRALVVPFRGLVKALSKTWYVKFQYKYITHNRLNLKDPKKYTEKLQYLRLYVYPKWKAVSECTSRDGVRNHVKNKGFANNLIPIYGIYDTFDDIDFDKLPNQFVIKCTHACAFNYLCKDKSKINVPALRKQFKKWLKTNYGKKTVEMHYAPIKPRIIIEQFLFENLRIEQNDFQNLDFNFIQNIAPFYRKKNLYLLSKMG